MTILIADIPAAEVLLFVKVPDVPRTALLSLEVSAGFQEVARGFRRYLKVSKYFQTPPPMFIEKRGGGRGQQGGQFS